jgi:hypothetical protein
VGGVCPAPSRDWCRVSWHGVLLRSYRSDHQLISRREKALKALLHRHPSPASSEITFLTESLKVPLAWIHESNAAELASSDDKYGEYNELVKAGLYDRAHKILIQYLAGEAVLREDLGLLRRLCGMVEGKANGWEYGGKVSWLSMSRFASLAWRTLRCRNSCFATLTEGTC